MSAKGVRVSDRSSGKDRPYHAMPTKDRGRGHDPNTFEIRKEDGILYVYEDDAALSGFATLEELTEFVLDEVRRATEQKRALRDYYWKNGGLLP